MCFVSIRESLGNKEPNVMDNVFWLLMEEIERFCSLILVYHIEIDSSSELDEWSVLVEKLVKCLGIAPCRDLFSRQIFRFPAMLAVSYQLSMIIISEFNFSGTHGNNPIWGHIEYVSSELHEISVLAEQLA
jgi:hypothetical protein